MSSPATTFTRIVEIMRRLRAPGGCPWDRQQTLDSIRPHTLEETYEVLEAIGDRNWPGLREELGDLLLQVVFYAEIAEEQDLFSIDEVLTTLADKLVRRHPHVFGADRPGHLSPEEALGRWNAIKAQEKREAGAGNQPPVAVERSLLAGIPKEFPALAEAGKLSQRAARVGFDWPDVSGIWAKIQEELEELRAEAGKDTSSGEQRTERLEDELGDVLFSVVNLARRLQLEPEAALKHANRKFQRRFAHIEAAARAQGRELTELSATEWDRLWNEAKRETQAPAPVDAWPKEAKP